MESLGAFYAIWVAIGLVMAAVLYEPAFTVLAKWFRAPGERMRAMTSLTLVAALDSFIFLPFSQALIDAHGWRDALVVLAVVLAAVTVPLHALVLRPSPDARHNSGHPQRSAEAGPVLRSAPFWLLSAAFFLATLAGIAMIVHAIPFLLERGHGASFVAFAVGLIGFSQIPGRLLFVALASQLPRAGSTSAVFVFVALGIGIVAGIDGTGAVIGGLVLLGMGNGMVTLARATVIADRYGSAAYGTIGGVAAAVTTAARAAGPVAGAACAAAVGYAALLWTLAVLAALGALLAYRAERAQTQISHADSSWSASGRT